MLKTHAIIEGFSKDLVFKAIADVSIRKQWDKIFSEFKVIDANEQSEVLYMLIRVIISIFNFIVSVDVCPGSRFCTTEEDMEGFT